MDKHSIDWNLQASKEAKYQEFLDKINELKVYETPNGNSALDYESVLDIAWEVFCG